MPGTRLSSKSGLSDRYAGRESGAYMRSMPASGTAALRLLVHVVPGLEDVAADEIAGAVPGAELAGVWTNFDERTSLLEYRAAGNPSRWLALGTVEDVFALAARARSLHNDRSGLHELAAATLTSKHLDRAMGAYTECRGGAPCTFRVVARQSGTHAYRRVDAQRAVEGALCTRLPRLRLVADEADAEFWLSVVGREALVGLRLSTHRMRGHAYPFDSLPASLKPTVARAMVRLSQPRTTDVVLDPLCGAGTLLIERALAAAYSALYGGDREPSAVAIAQANARAAGVRIDVQAWDALTLPLSDRSVDVVLANPPFGKKVAIDGGPYAFYRRLAIELRRVLRPGGRLVLITSQADAFRRSVTALPSPLLVRQRVPVLVRGERATIFLATANM
jgi:tRNA (guanine6-N2)-methyltransferase